MRAAIIGGTGVYGMQVDSRVERVSTPFGTVEVDLCRFGDKEIVFLARHGRKHSTPPHLINFRANMRALKELDVKYIYATGAVGSCNERFNPGEIVLLKDFIDFTKQRPVTFYDGKEGVIHASMADPYCKNLRELFWQEAQKEGLKVAGEAVYVCTEGPRFETAAEIKMYSRLGGDVVGMTNVPEVVLAKELGMCYAAVGIITNWCTGMGREVELEEIMAAVESNKTNLTNLFVKILLHAELAQNNCQCSKALMKL
ncbi:S-methyl-5'-thioinosine phosphorylase [Zhaonella formicivorans]|uniref:S-methyl-5'-thioinosine phosphorylase n=1 Tax=Zhaonella formicivorans TaxID=2528593 RepID=UPI0010D9892D|nr:S-methyl-5'-thioinosine phosphorylase [Zhaonella formicivorans]